MSIQDWNRQIFIAYVYMNADTWASRDMHTYIQGLMSNRSTPRGVTTQLREYRKSNQLSYQDARLRFLQFVNDFFESVFELLRRVALMHYFICRYFIKAGILFVYFFFIFLFNVLVWKCMFTWGQFSMLHRLNLFFKQVFVKDHSQTK